tara:strand:+ start:119 stop:1339 length:1221 start_codon:yes stop_codon:yes gene_type:complete
VFSGIEASTVGWHDLGWTPVAFADIDEFPSAVLAHHYPTVPNVGDVVDVDWEQYKGKADLIVGGSPCQSFSHAGRRLGLDDPRGNLALHYLRIVRAVQPKWFIYENVPGLLSSSEGEDFATFLGEVAKLGYGFAYRILDAQYFGVPQRRRRIFVVGCADGDWRSAAAILFDKSSLSRNLASSKEKRQKTTLFTNQRVGSESRGDRRRIIPIHDKATRHKGGGEGRNDDGASNFLGVGKEKEPMYSLTTNDQHMVFQAVKEDRADTLTAGMYHRNGINNQDLVTNGHLLLGKNTVAPTLTASNDPSRSPQSSEVTNQISAVFKASSVVRRLTPTECERLQGFPDGYTQIAWKGKPAENCPDSHRYKALGNSMATPVMKWIGERIDMLGSTDISNRGKSKTSQQMKLW